MSDAIGPSGAEYLKMTKLHNTISWLKTCQEARAEGFPVSFTTDPAWLVQMAINRRAGWRDDPSLSRGSCMPVNGRYPKKASGDYFAHLQLIAREVNTPGLRMRVSCLGEHRWLAKKLPHRFITDTEDDA